MCAFCAKILCMSSVVWKYPIHVRSCTNLYLCLFALQLFVRTININSYYNSVCICSGIILYSTSNFRPCTIRFRFGRGWWGANVQHSAMSQCRRHALRHSARRRKLASLTFPVPPSPYEAHSTSHSPLQQCWKEKETARHGIRLEAMAFLPAHSFHDTTFICVRVVQKISRTFTHFVGVCVCGVHVCRKNSLSNLCTPTHSHITLSHMCAQRHA